MKNYIVDDMEVLADDIIFELASQSTEFKNISVIGHYEDIEPIIKKNWLVMMMFTSYHLR